MESEHNRSTGRLRAGSVSPAPPLFRWTCVCVLFALLVENDFALGQESDAVADIIQTIAAQEEVYDADIELYYTETYRAEPLNDQGNVIKNRFRSCRIVHQGELSYFRQEGSATRYDQQTDSQDTERGFDGSQTIYTIADSSATIYSRRVEDPDRFRPHWNLLSGMGDLGPLSAALRKWRSEGGAIELLKSTEYDNLTCRRLRVVGPPAEGSWTFDLWLAEDRGFIPVKMEARGLSGQNEGVVLDWTLLESGLWFPTRSKVLVTVPYYTRDKSKALHHNFRELVVDKILLNPHYDRSLFRNIRLPDDAPVYKYDGDKIVESYINHPKTLMPSWWFAIVLIGIVLVAAALLVWRRFLLKESPVTQ